jgi:hypothetical protein
MTRYQTGDAKSRDDGKFDASPVKALDHDFIKFGAKWQYAHLIAN